MEKYLFAGQSLDTELRGRLQRATAFTRDLDPDRVLETPVPDLVEQVVEQFRIECPELQLDDRYTSGAKDVQIDVTGDPRFFFPGRAGRHTIPGTRFELRVPFTGEAFVFTRRPSRSSMNPPRGEVTASELVIGAEMPANSLDNAQMQQSLQYTLTRIQSSLEVAGSQIAAYNDQLRSTAEQGIERRKKKVLADRSLEEFLAVPVERRKSPSAILAVDVPRRRPKPQPRIAPKGYVPEPVITDQDYKDIVATIASFGLAAERYPETFTPMREEVLRELLLVILTNQFGPAVGEMFSRQGKTDIAILNGGGPVFIAECKIWEGPSAFAAAIDQLLSYLTWRDTKAAVILFIKRRDPSAAIEKAVDAIRAHANYKREPVAHPGDQPVFVLHHPDDVAREIEVALVSVPIPRRDHKEPEA